MKIYFTRKVNMSGISETTFVGRDHMLQAIDDLKRSSLKLWIYFISNRNDKEFNKEQSEIIEFLHMKYDTFNDALNDLVEKGYLERTGKRTYNAYMPEPINYMEI